MDIDKYRARLQQFERELAERVGRELASARDTTDEQPDSGDRSVVGELRDEYFGLAETDSEILANVRAALSRIEAGTFGVCVLGSERISEARLDAVPWTPYCLQHQEELEAAEGVRTPRA